MISCCLITKNEERHLNRCLSSVKDYVDEIIIIDSGSTDQTLTIAKSFSAKIIEIEWINDFSYARNIAINMAKGDWIIFLDGDESIIGINHLISFLKRVQSNVGGIVLARHDHFIDLQTGKITTTPVGTVRIFRKHTRVRFQYPVHEIVSPSIIESGFEFRNFNQAHIFHHIDQHTEEFLIKKQQYYLSLIDSNLKANPSDAWLMYQKAKTKWFFEKNKEAMELFGKVWKGSFPLEIRAASLNNCGVLSYLDGQLEKAIAFLQKSLSIYPNQSQAHFILSDVLYKKGSFLEGLFHLTKVKTKPHVEHKHQYLPGGLFLFKHQKAYRMALFTQALGLNLFAKISLNKSLRHKPDYVDALLLKAKWAYRKGEKFQHQKIINTIQEINPEWKILKNKDLII